MAALDRIAGLASETTLAIKAPVAVATTGANILLAGVQVIDGLTVGNANERVLVKDQADQTQNGIYIASSGNWTLGQDAGGNTDWTAGTLVSVASGATYAGTLFKQTCADSPVVIGTSLLAFSPVQSVLGTTAYAAAYVYSGGVANSLLFAARGSADAPVTDQGATVVFQSAGGQTGGSGTTLYASWLKETTTAFVGGRPAWFEAVDPKGGANSFVEGLRASSYLSGGTGGNTVGAVALGIAAAATAAAACIGLEAQAFNLDTAKTATFSSASFAASIMATCGQGAGNAADAAFITNPFSHAPFITGFFVPAGTPRQSVSDTAFRCDGTVINGLDLSRGTYSGTQIKWTNGSIDPSGNIISGAGIAAGAASGIFWAGRSIMQSPADGVIEFTNQAVTGFTSLKLGGATASFPAIKRNGTALNFRLADDSGDAAITAANVTASGVYSVGANQVVGARQTGWTVMTGSIQRGTFATGSVTLAQLAGVVMALETDLITHGLIGT